METGNRANAHRAPARNRGVLSADEVGAALSRVGIRSLSAADYISLDNIFANLLILLMALAGHRGWVAKMTKTEVSGRAPRHAEFGQSIGPPAATVGLSV